MSEWTSRADVFCLGNQKLSTRSPRVSMINFVDTVSGQKSMKGRSKFIWISLTVIDAREFSDDEEEL